jgi:hypothetical protein
VHLPINKKQLRKNDILKHLAKWQETKFKFQACHVDKDGERHGRKKLLPPAAADCELFRRRVYMWI